jgi:large subunit ribosomal protein L29
MKASELRGRTAEDLHKEVQKLRRELFAIDFTWQAEENPDVSKKRKIRRDIARVLTVLRQMQAGSEAPKSTT